MLGLHPKCTEIMLPFPIPVTIYSFSVLSSTAPGSLLNWPKGGDCVSERMFMTSLLICFPELFVQYIRQGVKNDVTVEKYNIL